MTSHNNARPDSLTSFEFISSQGEMSGHLRRHNWMKTVLGDPSLWPDSLRAALSICMGSSFPIAIYWGPEFLLLYNDAWSPILGKKHPGALGRSASDVWPEIWDTIGPMLRHVLSTGEATRSKDQLLPMHRHGFTEECYFDYTFSPIYGRDGQVGGILNIVVETTFRVIGERRTKLLRDLGEHTAGARTAEEACTLAAAVFSSDPADLPFCVLYLLDCGSSSAKLAASVGLPEDHPARPLRIDMSNSQVPWPLASIHEGRPVILVEELAERFGSACPGTIWQEPCREAVLLPFGSTGTSGPAGVFVAGISPRLAFDREYEGFVSQAAALTGSAVNNANAYQGERRRAESLAELDRAKSAFFSNVSHELRTPLTLMLGPLEETLKLSEDIPPDGREYLQVAHRNGLRLHRLVNSLLDFSRIEAGRMQANLQPVDISTVTADLASNFRSAMERAGLEYTIECPPLPCPAYVDLEMWEKIVLNLLANAFKFTHAGTVALRLSHGGSTFELSVSDTGSGIPEHELPRIFERFHRAANTHARTHEGTGIGLALTHELVRLHDGEISVTSKAGKGSTFRVTIPYAPAHQAAAPARQDQPLASTAVHAGSLVEEALRWISTPAQQDRQISQPRFGSRGRILLADDNPDMREYLERLLSQQYKVTAVADGQEALASAISDPPDLVLSDIMMPGLDGIGLLHALRSHPATRLVPVLLLSARAGSEASAEGFGAGADDYIVKPFTARELLARVGSHLSRKQERQRAYELLSQVFAQAPVSICLLQGPEFVVELANSKFAALASGPEIEGRRLKDVMPDLEENIWELLRRVLETGEPFVGPEIHVHL